MRRLFLAASALTLAALAACGRQESSTDSEASAPARQPADAIARPTRAVTQASAVISADSGAYGMPRAPIPYNELEAYERQRDQAGRRDPTSVQPGQPSAPPQSQTSKPRNADTVFY
jgi:hypothetical protein